MQNDTTSNIIKTPDSPDGYQVGQASDDKVGFYGTAPIARPSGAAQAAITDSSGGTANSATGVVTLTGTYNSTILANAFATVIAQGNALRSALTNLGLIAGS